MKEWVTAMEIFRELFIRGEPHQLVATADTIEQAFSDGWTRERAAEAKLHPMLGSTNRHAYCFACSKKGRRPAAALFLLEKDAHVFYVTNIVPDEKHQLSHAEYNALMEEFYTRFARPCAEKAGARAELTDSNVDLEHWMSPRTAERLRRFSGSANKSTGSAHPADKELWFDFVLAAHQERSSLDASTLGRWLIEVDGWSTEVADDLAIQYERERALLAFSDGRRIAG